MRLYFSQSLPEEEILKFIDEEIARKTDKLERLESQLNLWTVQGMTKTQRITYDYGVSQYKAALGILETARQSYI